MIVAITRTTKRSSDERDAVAGAIGPGPRRKAAGRACSGITCFSKRQVAGSYRDRGKLRLACLNEGAKPL
jgi:hypothetical protein